MPITITENEIILCKALIVGILATVVLVLFFRTKTSINATESISETTESIPEIIDPTVTEITNSFDINNIINQYVTMDTISLVPTINTLEASLQEYNEFAGLNELDCDFDTRVILFHLFRDLSDEIKERLIACLEDAGMVNDVSTLLYDRDPFIEAPLEAYKTLITSHPYYLDPIFDVANSISETTESIASTTESISSTSTTESINSTSVSKISDIYVSIKSFI